uniref:Uncharacterized protein n=1 Tax=Apteryx owenii TaxID=8824 RepID=A0A8B9QCC5_APTOW
GGCQRVLYWRICLPSKETQSEGPGHLLSSSAVGLSSKVALRSALILHGEQQSCKFSSLPLFCMQFMYGALGGLGLSAFVRGSTHTHTHIYISFFIYLFIYLFICVCTYIYIYMYVCITMGEFRAFVRREVSSKRA